MKHLKLESGELRDMIAHYQSELRKLEYQFYKTASIVEELENLLALRLAQEKPNKPQLPEAKIHAMPPASVVATNTEEITPAEEVKESTPDKPAPKKRGRKTNAEKAALAAAAANENAEAPATNDAVEVVEVAQSEEIPAAEVETAAPTAAEEPVAETPVAETPAEENPDPQPEASPAVEETTKPRTRKKNGNSASSTHEAIEVEIIPPTNPSNPNGPKRDLSDWDKLFLSQIKQLGKVFLAADLLDIALYRNQSEQMNLSEEEVKTYISRSLHKLCNKRGDIVKIKSPSGKGNSYALVNWFNSKGMLLKRYL